MKNSYKIYLERQIRINVYDSLLVNEYSSEVEWLNAFYRLLKAFNDEGNLVTFKKWDKHQRIDIEIK